MSVLRSISRSTIFVGRETLDQLYNRPSPSDIHKRQYRQNFFHLLLFVHSRAGFNFGRQIFSLQEDKYVNSQ